MWKLWHWLFGWDYIHWDTGHHQGIARLWHDQTGRVVYWQYQSISSLRIIEHPAEVTWLTCSPEKFFPGVCDHTPTQLTGEYTHES